MKIFIYAVILVVVFAVIGGFMVVGSPKEERLRKFDERKVSDLQTIQSRILEYWGNKKKVPDSLDLLNDDLIGFRVPKDPETGNDYEYYKQGQDAFQLCAVFNRQSIGMSSDIGMRISKPVGPGGYIGSMASFSHGPGRTCFDRNIDKDLYAPAKKID